MEGAITAIEYVTRSSHRVRLLEVLAEGDRSLEELQAVLDASGRTVRRGIDGLIDEGWVAETDAGYGLTQTGVSFATDLFDFLDRTEMLLELRTFFEWFPESACDLDVDAFEGSTVTLPGPHTPYAPIERTLELITNASRFETIAPINSPFYEDSYYELIVDDGAEATTILSNGVLEAITAEDDGSLSDVLETGRAEIYVYPEELTFGLLLTDDVVAIGAYDDSRSMRALLESDVTPVRAWAESTFDDYRSDATRFTLTDWEC